MMAVTIPKSHCNLLVGPILRALVAMMPDGQPQASVGWVDFDGAHVLINTTLEPQKGRNMRANPQVTVLAVDPENTRRWVEVRGRVEETTSAGAQAHADRLLQRYSGKCKWHFYGDVYPVEQRELDTRVIVKIVPNTVYLDGSSAHQSLALSCLAQSSVMAPSR